MNSEFWIIIRIPLLSFYEITLSGLSALSDPEASIEWQLHTRPIKLLYLNKGAPTGHGARWWKKLRRRTLRRTVVWVSWRGRTQHFGQKVAILKFNSSNFKFSEMICQENSIIEPMRSLLKTQLSVLIELKAFKVSTLCPHSAIDLLHCTAARVSTSGECNQKHGIPNLPARPLSRSRSTTFHIPRDGRYIKGGWPGDSKGCRGWKESRVKGVVRKFWFLARGQSKTARFMLSFGVVARSSVPADRFDDNADANGWVYWFLFLAPRFQMYFCFCRVRGWNVTEFKIVKFPWDIFKNYSTSAWSGRLKARKVRKYHFETDPEVSKNSARRSGNFCHFCPFCRNMSEK